MHLKFIAFLLSTALGISDRTVDLVQKHYALTVPTTVLAASLFEGMFDDTGSPKLVMMF